ncbi:MAG: alkane 1-monooxygenase, partial [Algoriphagus sp.]
MSSLKKIGFFSALFLPLLLILGTRLGGGYLFMVHAFVFILVPIMDYFISRDKQNVPLAAVSQVTNDNFYKLVTFFWVYVQLAIVIWGFWIVSNEQLVWWEWLAFSSGMALITGGIGITVAHELGHKKGRLEQSYAKTLLMTVCYMHFIIEHNRGHHVRVATPEDPATSRVGENFYAFWFRSVVDGYRSAWDLERDRLARNRKAFLSIHNQMIQFLVIPLLFVATGFFVFSFIQNRLVWEIPLFFFLQSFFGFSLLELVNYLEHYGMERRKMPSGIYERVTPLHSWNASEVVSNFLLFQLQRHSDHHANAYKRYQVLNHYDESPQLPAGYSAMIILALFPPLWFRVMNPRLDFWKK